MKLLSDDDKNTIYENFHKLVNLSEEELASWLNTVESHSVGIVSGTVNQKKTLKDARESIGHESGVRILSILATHKDELDDDDYRHMKRVVGYIKRHQAQIPAKSDIRTSRWRYSLMNWGHDPLVE